MGMFNNMSINGMSTVPNGSIWRSGLNERRPWLFAVGSPSLYAANAWPISCSTIAGTNARMEHMTYGIEIPLMRL